MDNFLGEVDLVRWVPFGQSMEEKDTAEGGMAWRDTGQNQLWVLMVTVLLSWVGEEETWGDLSGA